MNNTTASTSAQRAIIKCDQLSKRYGSTLALDNVSLNLDAGPPIALIGPNGAGKTTFMSLLCGFIKPGSGRVSILGHQPGSRHALPRISALPQDAWLDPNFSITRQLRHYAQLRGLGKRAAKTETARVLEKVKLSDRANSKPDQLSHGMRKRIMIAQALIGDPDLILLDEPTAGIDPPNVKIIRELIAAESTNATFVISSHNLDELEKVCTKVVHLAEGRLQGISDIDENSNDGFLSVTLRQQNSAPPIELINQLPGVTKASFRPQTDLQIEYDEENYPDTDIAVITTLTDNNWRYRKIVKGRSLEEQMFSRAASR